MFEVLLHDTLVVYCDLISFLFWLVIPTFYGIISTVGTFVWVRPIFVIMIIIVCRA